MLLSVKSTGLFLQERDDYKKQFAAAAAESGRVLKDETSKTDIVRGDFSIPFHADRRTGDIFSSMRPIR